MTEISRAYRKTLLEQAFSNEQGLMLRQQLHDYYSVPQINMPAWVLDRYAWQGGETVLDVGSGPGMYLDEIFSRIPPAQYIAGDLSFGMLKALRERTDDITSTVLDAENLPFPDNSFDIVLANNMLYHVPDLERAILEIRRVLRNPKGVLIAATSSEYTMPEFNTLIQRAVRLLRQAPSTEMDDISLTQTFSLEKGPVILARHFQSVARFDIPSAFVFRETQPVIDYIESCRPFYEVYLPNSIEWDAFMTIMTDQIRRLVDHFGELVVNKLGGVVIATDEGGFAQTYRELLSHAKTDGS